MRKLRSDTARITKQPSYFLVEFLSREAVYERPMDTLSDAIAFCEKFDLDVIEIVGLHKS